jgi:hypothetical protein
MRSFSSEEKEYLKHIVDAYKSDNWAGMKLSNLIQSIFDRELYFNELFPFIQLKEGESGIDKNVVGYSKAIKKAYIPISNFNSLLFYLDSNHLIFIVPYFSLIQSLEEEARNANKSEQQLYTNFFRIEKETYLDFLRSNLSDFVCPTQELIDFVDAGFITKQEKQFNVSTKLAKWGIGIAIFIGISSLMIGIAGLFYNKTPVVSNTFNPQVIIKTKEDVNSITQKPNTVDSLKVNQSKNKLTIKK